MVVSLEIKPNYSTFVMRGLFSLDISSIVQLSLRCIEKVE